MISIYKYIELTNNLGSGVGTYEGEYYLNGPKPDSEVLEKWYGLTYNQKPFLYIDNERFKDNIEYSISDDYNKYSDFIFPDIKRLAEKEYFIIRPNITKDYRQCVLEIYTKGFNPMFYKYDKTSESFYIGYIYRYIVWNFSSQNTDIKDYIKIVNRMIGGQLIC